MVKVNGLSSPEPLPLALERFASRAEQRYRGNGTHFLRLPQMSTESSGWRAQPAITLSGGTQAGARVSESPYLFSESGPTRRPGQNGRQPARGTQGILTLCRANARGRPANNFPRRGLDGRCRIRSETVECAERPRGQLLQGIMDAKTKPSPSRLSRFPDD